VAQRADNENQLSNWQLNETLAVSSSSRCKHPNAQESAVGSCFQLAGHDCGTNVEGWCRRGYWERGIGKAHMHWLQNENEKLRKTEE